MTRRWRGSSKLCPEQQSFARGPGTKFECQTLRLVGRLDPLEPPNQDRRSQAAMGHRVLADDSRGV
jgi:hypothetical protein